MNRILGVYLLAAAMCSCVGMQAWAQDEPVDPHRAPRAPGRTPPTLPDDFPSTLPATIADRIAKSHNERAWRAHNAFTCDIKVEFGGIAMLEGSMLLDINGGRVRFDLKDSTKLLWDGEKAWVSPASSMFEAAHYHLHTWPAMLTLPFQLNARGTETQEMPVTKFGSRVCNTIKVTFDRTSPRITPDDWQIVYSDLVTHSLYGMAFISTYGKTLEDAERAAQFVLFDQPVIVNQVVIPRTWTFFNWSEDKGKYGPELGRVTLANMNFTQLREDAFKKPADAREDTMPTPPLQDDEPDDEPAEPRNAQAK